MDQLQISNSSYSDKFIFCLEAVPDVETGNSSEVISTLEELAFEHGITSIYKTCDTIEGFEDSLNALRYDDHNFKNYDIIYLVIQGEGNTICINDYYYSIEEIAELFEGKLTGKILHFANTKVLDLSDEEAQYFLDITGAKAVSGFGADTTSMSSHKFDKVFFILCQQQDDLVEVAEKLQQKYFDLCQLFDFKMYY